MVAVCRIRSRWLPIGYHSLHRARSAAGSGAFPHLAVFDPLPRCAGGFSEGIGGDRMRVAPATAAAMGARGTLEGVSGGCGVCHDCGSRLRGTIVCRYRFLKVTVHGPSTF